MSAFDPKRTVRSRRLLHAFRVQRTLPLRVEHPLSDQLKNGSGQGRQRCKAPLKCTVLASGSLQAKSPTKHNELGETNASFATCHRGGVCCLGIWNRRSCAAAGPTTGAIAGVWPNDHA